MNTEQFIQKAQTIHGNKFGYANVIFGLKVQITCFEHGDFLTNPSNHLYRKSGCPKCANELASKRYSSNTEEFIQKARNVHGDCYDYSRAVYKNNSVKVSIRCIKHDIIFEQSPGNHLGGQGCPECGFERRVMNRTTPLTDYLKKASAKHNNRYDYTNVSESDYLSGKIRIICKDHGEFQQSKRDHLHNSAGCPVCSLSKGELAVKRVLESLNIPFIQQKTFPDLYVSKKNCKLKYDFFLPNNNLLIEYDGEQHFEPRFDVTEEQFQQGKRNDNLKDLYAKNNNIELLRIPYTDLSNIDSIIRGRLGLK
jgi:hypothetical protein